jgi:GMC oxidoreductase
MQSSFTGMKEDDCTAFAHSRIIRCLWVQDPAFAATLIFEIFLQRDSVVAPPPCHPSRGCHPRAPLRRDPTPSCAACPAPVARCRAPPGCRPRRRAGAARRADTPAPRVQRGRRRGRRGGAKSALNFLSANPELRVHGIAGLRVADAAIMPTVVSGNTNAATIMIGERVADLVREQLRLAA